MKKHITIYASITIILFSSCAGIHSGFVNNSASLNSANFSYIKKDVQGKSSALYVLGIGGLAKQSLINEAKANMLENNQVKDNQAIANTTVTYKKSYFLGIVSTVECTISADIVEFR
jgi:hypothetical protein